MAFSNTKPHMSLLLATFVTCFLFLLNKAMSADSICFTSTSFPDNVQDIIFQGDATASDGVLLLTKLDSSGNPTKSSKGQAIFACPIHLWESSTGRAASFSTTFSFIIKKSTGTPADGITFFLNDVGTPIPSISAGGYLGIYGGNNSNPFVAVEFDTFKNPWDPITVPHIGIDINSVTSNQTADWITPGDLDGSIAFAKIIYSADSKELSVTVTYPNVSGSGTSTLTYENLDFKEFLPEWVQIGLSAATGDYVQTHTILSWSFTSNLPSSSEASKKVM